MKTKRATEKTSTRLFWGREFVAYFFEEHEYDKDFPISVKVFAVNLEEALEMLRTEFPGKRISALHTDSSSLHEYSRSDAVLVSPNLPRKCYRLPTDAARRVIEDRRSHWRTSDPDRITIPSEVKQLRHLRTTLATMGYSDAHPAMVEICGILKTFDPLPEIL